MQDLLTELITKALNQESNAKRGFAQSVQVYIGLKEIDLKKPENRFVALIELPHVTPKMERKIGVITEGGTLAAARELGVRVLTRQQVESASGDKKAARKLLDGVDLLIAEAPLMPLVGKVFGPFLGPTDRMPTPVPPNADISPVVQRLKRSVSIKVKTQSALSVPIGTEDMPLDQLRENAAKVVSEVERRVPNGLKSFESLAIKTTMGKLTSSKVRMR